MAVRAKAQIQTIAMGTGNRASWVSIQNFEPMQAAKLVARNEAAIGKREEATDCAIDFQSRNFGSVTDPWHS